ncbi:MAG: hypothetical protein ACK4ZM_01810 [bacterium]
MDNKKIKIIESMILLNTFKYEECRTKIEQYLEEEEFIYYRLILKILDLIELTTTEQDFYNKISEIYQLTEEIEEDNLGREFKNLVKQILEEFKNHSFGFPKKKTILNWQIFV